MLSAARPHLAYLSAKVEEFSRCNTWVGNAGSLAILDYLVSWIILRYTWVLQLRSRSRTAEAPLDIFMPHLGIGIGTLDCFR